MAQYQFFCLIIVAALGTQSCWSDLQRTTLRSPDMTLPSLLKEVEDNSRYKTLEANATILNLLVNDKGGVSRSEVFDMLHSRDDREEHIDLPIFPEDIEEEKADVPLTPDSQAEYLQGSESVVNKDAVRARYRGEGPGAAAGIMVLVTCSIVCLAYTALIVWRRIYLKRNGLKHELLRNEETMAETRIEL